MVLTRAPYGSLYAEKQALWAPAYESRLQIIGTTGIIVPMGDDNHQNAGRTTVTTVGEEQVVFTYSEAVDAWDVPPTFEGPGQIPIVTFNGTNEQADTPDSDYFTRGDSSDDSPFSIGAWMIPTGDGVLMSKFATSNREWRWFHEATAPTLYLSDESAADISRSTSSTVSNGTLAFVVFTYDGAGGASAADTINCYMNGTLNNGTATNNAGYVAMQAGTAKTEIGSRSAGFAGFWTGQIVGGPLAPFFTQIELTADQVLELYQHDRALLGV